jgi:hypothetical protein
MKSASACWVGKQHRLRERAHVDHPAVAVEGLERLDRPPAVAELAVVVVLDDGGVGPVGPLEQGEAPREREHDAERVLVRRCDEHDLGAFGDVVHDEALLVDRHREDLDAE